MQLNPPFFVQHQYVNLSFDFESKTYSGYTTITAVPTSITPDVYNNRPVLFLNAQKMSISKVLVNNIDVSFTHSPIPSLLDLGPSRRDFHAISSSLSSYSASQSNHAELTIFLPSPSEFSFASLTKKDALKLTLKRRKTKAAEKKFKKSEFKTFTITVFFDSNFFFNSDLFSFISEGVDSSSGRCFIPCVDHYLFRPTWDFDLSFPNDYSAICPGILNKEKNLYELTIPTTASKLGLIIGKFLKISSDDSLVIPCELYSINQSQSVSFSGSCSSFSSSNTTSLLNNFYNSKLPELLKVFSTIKPIPFIKFCFSPFAPYNGTWFSGVVVLPLESLRPLSLVSRKVKAESRLFKTFLSCIFDTFVTNSASFDSWTSTLFVSVLFSTLFPDFVGNDESTLFQFKNRYSVYHFDQSPLQLSISPPPPGHQQVDYDLIGSQSIKELNHLGRLEFRNSFRNSYFHWKKLLLVTNHLGRSVGFSVLSKLIISFLNDAIEEVSCFMTNTPIVPFHSYYSISGQLKSFINEIEFVNFIRNNSNMDVATFINHWIYTRGLGQLHFKFFYNRRAIQTELGFKQFCRVGIPPFFGPLVVNVYEPDGSFEETINVSFQQDRTTGMSSKLSLFLIKARSRNRRPRKRRVFDDEGKESDVLAKTPVMAINCDRTSEVPGLVVVKQHPYMWSTLLSEYSLSPPFDLHNALSALQGLCDLDTPASAFTIKYCAADSLEHLFKDSYSEVPLVVRRAAVWFLAQMKVAEASFLLIKLARETLFNEFSFPLPLPSYNSEPELVEFFIEIVDSLYKLKVSNDEVFDLCFDLLNRYVDDVSASDNSHYFCSILRTVSRHVATEVQALKLKEVLDKLLSADEIVPSFAGIVSCAVLKVYMQLIRKHLSVLSSQFYKSLLALVLTSATSRQLRVTAGFCLVSLMYHFNPPIEKPVFNVENSQLKSQLHPFYIVPFLVSVAVSDNDSLFGRQLLGQLLHPPPLIQHDQTVLDPYTSSLESPPPRFTEPLSDDCMSLFREKEGSEVLVKFPELMWKLIANPKLDNYIRSLLTLLWLRIYGHGTPPCFVGSVSTVVDGSHPTGDCFKKTEGEVVDGKGHEGEVQRVNLGSDAM
ncbi:hypothetical protein P9112_000100 [Eukaryota sp. TZLM1-RC]